MLTALESISLDREITRRSLYGFVQIAWPWVESVDYQDNWHIDVLCGKAQALHQKTLPGGKRKLRVNIPPSCMKSLIYSVFFPVWLWTHDPTQRLLFGAYSLEKAIDDSNKRRRLIQTDWFQKRWGRSVRLTGDQNAKIRYDNSSGGWMQLISPGGTGATGRHPNGIILDDPNDAGEGAAERARANQWYSGTLGTRGMSLDVWHLLVQQRVHQKDMSGYTAEMDGWDEVVLPMEFEPDRASPYDKRKQAGELLWPSLITPEKVAQLKGDPSFDAAGQFQQRPSPAKGIVFNSDHFQYFKVQEKSLSLEPRDGGTPIVFSWDDCYWFQTIDTAMKTGQLNDYTVIATWGITPKNDLLLYDVFRDRVKIPDQFGLVRSQRVRFPFIADNQYVEDKASGTGLIQQGAADGMHLRALQPGSADKVDRCQSFAAMLQQAKVYFLSGGPWLGEYEAELLTFPKGAHDDQVDASAYAAKVLQERAAKKIGIASHSMESIAAKAKRFADRLAAAVAK